MRTINIGIVAHVDAGKTSITEKLLYTSGSIDTIGSVDKGTSITDWLEVEKERGISVRTATASLVWNNIKINIIDTPGHVDFSSEVSRSIMAMDVVLLVISAVEGIQGHTSTLWDVIVKSKKQCLIFINKCDRDGAEPENIISSAEKEFKSEIIPLNGIQDVGTDHVSESHNILGDNALILNDDIYEQIINGDDTLFEKYLDGVNIEHSDLEMSLKSQIQSRKLVPAIIGAAKFDVSIVTLLDAIGSLFFNLKDDKDGPPSGIVYKVDHDPKMGKIASIRLFSGIIKNRDLLNINNVEEKVTQIRQLQGSRFKDTGILEAGDTAAVCGLTSVVAGDVFGINIMDQENVKLSTPVLSVRITILLPDQYSKLVIALQELSIEDPELDLIWNKELKEINIKIMGIMQLQVLKSVIKSRYDIEVEFDEPSVIYKESPVSEFTVVEEYTMPKPCWAIVRFQIEPLPLGTGVLFESKVGVNKIAIQYQQEVERNIFKALQQGIHGWEVTDLKITLIGDEHHNVHSRAGDFGVATHMALMKGFDQHGTKILEPILRYKIVSNEEFIGKIVGSLTQLRATFENPFVEDGKCIINGLIPVATSIDFPTKLASLTQGKGSVVTSFHGYQNCDLELGKTTPYRGVNPLNRSKFILKARKALI